MAPLQRGFPSQVTSQSISKKPEPKKLAPKNETKKQTNKNTPNYPMQKTQPLPSSFTPEVSHTHEVFQIKK